MGDFLSQFCGDVEDSRAGYFERMYRVELSSLLESGLSQEEAERVARGIVEIEKRRED